MWKAVALAARRARQVGWDERGRTARLFMAASAAGVLVFGGQNAGIAALGTAVGVPLWLVIGSGAAFANLLIEEALRRRATARARLTTTYTVIEAERIEAERIEPRR